MEFQMPGVEDDAMVFKTCVDLADRFKIRPVITNDCHYMERADFEVQKIMMAISQETTVNSPDLFHTNSSEQYMKTRIELYDRFKNNDYSNGVDDGFFQQACDNTLRISDMCKPLKVDSTPKIPAFDDSDNGLVSLVKARIKELGLHKVDKKYMIDGREVTYVEQAEIELKRFIEKGFSSYFLITQDLVKYGRDQGGLFVPRGSACGSLVCYLLGIGAVDPLKWGLSFDRFLSPSRGGYMLNVKMADD
jgi:DNA polymerase-3 subunit alpha